MEAKSYRIQFWKFEMLISHWLFRLQVFSHLFQAYGWNYYAEFALQLFTFSPATQKFVSINLALCPIGPSTTLANNPLQNPDYALAHDESIKVLCLI